MAQWKTGDTVRLKSGGPIMTVSHVKQNDEVWCHWFAPKNEATPLRADFHAEMLEAAKIQSGA